MTAPNPTHLHRLESAIGTDAVAALARRHLLRAVHVPVGPCPATDLVADRVTGAVLGLAVGDAATGWVRRHRHRRTDGADLDRWLDHPPAARPSAVSAATQLFVQSAEAWAHEAWAAPETIAAELVTRAPGLRSPGQAVRYTVQQLGAGARWWVAGSPSYGDAALPRAVAAGLASLDDPARAGFVGSLDAAVTHASKSATLCSAALSGIVVALVLRPDGAPWQVAAAEVVASADFEPTRRLLERALVDDDAPPVGEWEGDVRPHADEMLAVALWAQHQQRHEAVLDAALVVGDGDRTAVVVAAALWGAIHGAERLPSRAGAVEGHDALRTLATRLAAAVDGSVVRQPVDGVGPVDEERAGADIWFLLDRSGSMASIAGDVVAGFDRFFAEQRRLSGDASVTIVQFDNGDPHEVLVDAAPIDAVGSIADRFVPRAMTPLYDAIGRLLDRAEARGGVDDDQLVVIFTDGYENASTDWTRERVFARIGRLQQRGWTFVFLGANQDSYDVGGGMAVPAGNVSNFRADADGVAASYDGLSRSVREFRGKPRHERRRDHDDFWGGVKEAEE